MILSVPSDKLLLSHLTEFPELETKGNKERWGGGVGLTVFFKEKSKKKLSSLRAFQKFDAYVQGLEDSNSENKSVI